MLCTGCNENHEDSAWKYKDGWYCSKFFRVSVKPEFIPDRIREDRQAHFNSTIQPFRGGVVSKEYVDIYGSKGIDASESEIKKAKNVWTDLKGYNTRDKSI